MNVDQLYTVKDHEKGAEMQLKDQNGKNIKAYLTLAGLDSKLFRTSVHRMLIALRAEGEVDKDNVRAKALSEATISWRGLTDKGKKFEFSKEKAYQLYVNAPYVMDQVDKFISERENFTKG